MTTTRPTKPIRVGTTWKTNRFRLRFDGMQGELFTMDSSQWTFLKPGHPIDGTTLHLPTFASRRAVLAAANARFDQPHDS